MMKNFQIFPLILLTFLCLFSSWEVESTMISMKLAQSVCAQHTKFKEGGTIQSPIKTKPSDSPSGSGPRPKLSRKNYCWFYWQKVKKPGFYPIRCSSRFLQPGQTPTGGKSNTRIAYGEEIVPDEFPSYGRLYTVVDGEDDDDPDKWDHTLGPTVLQMCQATLIAESWAITGKKLNLQMNHSVLS